MPQLLKKIIRLAFYAAFQSFLPTIYSNFATMTKKQQFVTKIGLIAATVGSAKGLCVPVMLGEFSLGRGGRSDVIGVFRRLAPALIAVIAISDFL